MLLIVYLVVNSVNGERNHTECTRYARRERRRQGEHRMTRELMTQN